MSDYLKGVLAEIVAAGHESRAAGDRRRRAEELRSHRVLGELMQRVPESTRISSWTILHPGIDARIAGNLASGHENRAQLMMLAEQFGLKYTEAEHDRVRNIVAATGNYKDVPVKFWRFVEPCSCGECGVPR